MHIWRRLALAALAMLVATGALALDHTHKAW